MIEMFRDEHNGEEYFSVNGWTWDIFTADGNCIDRSGQASHSPWSNAQEAIGKWKELN